MLNAEKKLSNETKIREVIEYEITKIKAENYDLHRLVLSGRFTPTSGISASAYEGMFAKYFPSMSGLGCYFVQAKKQFEINSVLLVAICILESGGGTSRLAHEKYNLAGISNMQFECYKDCIYFLAKLLSDEYKDYSLIEIGEKYAEDKDWAKKVQIIMQDIVEEVDECMRVLSTKD